MRTWTKFAFCAFFLTLCGFYAAGQKTYICDFEKGACDFLQNAKNNTENWKIGQGKMNALDTGPSVDHTTGTNTGKYLFVNVTASRRSIVRLLGPNMKDDYCIDFWYHMFGIDVGSLRVIITYQAGSKTFQREYFKRTTSQGDRWKQGLFSIKYDKSSMKNGYQLEFIVQHTSRRNIRGDIALDDMEFIAGKCADWSLVAKRLCTFDDNICEFRRETYSRYLNWEWKAVSAPPTELLNSMPVEDHTLGTTLGGYWHASSSYSDAETYSILSSPSYEPPEDGKLCLHFYYYLQADDTEKAWLIFDSVVEQADLKIYRDIGAKGPLIWSRTKDNTRHRKWTYAEANFNATQRYQIDFRAQIVTEKVAATWAIDDVKVIEGQCPETGSCDFEDDKCNWEDGDNDIIWLRKQGSSNSNSENGPSTDKTSEKESGYYVYIDMADKDPNMVARLESEPFAPYDKSACVHFWYYMSGSKDLGTLKLLRNLEDITESTLWMLKGGQGSDKWIEATAPASETVLGSKFILEGTTGSDGRGFIALDDVLVRPGEICQVKPGIADPKYDVPGLIRCTFDDLNLCKWRQDEKTLPWQFGNVSLVESTGPKQPVNGKGHYIFVSSFSNESESSVARIISPVVASFYPEYPCFSFYYYMFGPHVGELRVVMTSMLNKTNEFYKQVVWRRRGSQPDKWMKFQDSLVTVTEGDYRLEIEADGGSGFTGDIAIDEISMSIGECSSTGLCDFESSLCRWTIEPSANKNFIWTRGSNLTNGPSTDHTTLSGFGTYLQAKSNDDALMGDETNLVSPKLGRNLGKHCLTFWYYRPGVGTGKIAIYKRIAGLDHDPFGGWSAANDVGKMWHFAQADLFEQKSYQIVITAEKGASNDENVTYEMAIDDLWLKNSPCESTGSCDFNSDYCGYSLNSTSDVSWLLGTGRVVNPSLLGQPPKDVTLENGMYAYVDFTSPYLLPGSQAVLVSELLESPSTGMSCLYFYQYISFQGTDKPSLSIGYMVMDNLDKEMSYNMYEKYVFNTPTQGMWKKTQLDITQDEGDQPHATFQVYFQAKKGKESNSFIAIDEIVFEDQQCREPTTTPETPVTEMPPSDLSCNFDNGDFCLWKADSTRIKWEISEPKKTKGNMPKYDNTQKNYNGRYAYVLGDGASPKVTNLTSPILPAVWKGQACLSFWYFMNTGSQLSNSLSLTALLSYSWSTARELKWRRAGNFGYSWRHAYVYIRRPKGTTPGIKAIFTAQVLDGVIAIDDLNAIRGECQITSKLCTFDGEEDMCGYVQDVGNTANWDVQAGEDDNLPYKMPDHTTQSISGQYLYIAFNATTADKDKKARILSEKRPAANAANCVTFYYHIYDTQKFGLNAFVVTDNGLSDPLWSVSAAQGLLWHGARFNAVSNVLPWQVMFEAEVGKQGTGQVALDDISVETGSCPQPGFCNFDKNNCLWENVQPPYGDTPLPKGMSQVFTDDVDWVTHIGEDYSGPPVDNTYGTTGGFYLLMDTRFAKENQRAVYISERLKTSSGACFQFWYSIPNKLNTAKLNIHTSSDFLTTTQVATITNNTNEQWKKELITIIPKVIEDSPYTNYWILLEGVAGSNKLGYLALDDLSVVDGMCEEQTELFDCQDVKEQHIMARDVCNFRNDCRNGFDEANCANCDFETGMCGWKPGGSNNDYFRWVRSEAGREGLEYDHTKEDTSGHFMVAASTGNTWNTNPAANLQSATLRNAFSTCSMEFWYNIFGKIDFNVRLRRNNVSTDIWMPEDRSPYIWTSARIILSRIARKFDIAFFAKKDSENNCHVAVDDISMLGCETPANKDEDYCPPDTFNCKNSRCIAPEQKCDYSDDCGNFEDERDETCAAAMYRCSFDRSMCDWAVEKPNTVTWSRRLPFTSLEQGPTRDHTGGTESGRFMYLAGRVNPSPMRMLGPFLSPSEGCELRLYYDICGKGVLNLQVKTRTAIGGEEKLVWSREDPTEGFYFIGDTISFSESSNFQVIIEGYITIGPGRANYIAIDDISFSQKCSPANNALPTAIPLTTSSPTIKCTNQEFRCASKDQCVDKTKVCDFHADCNDTSDEKKCGACDFVKNMCGLVDSSSGGSLKWSRRQAEAFALSRNSTVPVSDSNDDPNGYFAVLTTAKTGIYSPAILRTPKLGEMPASCKLEFHYHLNAVGGTLQVFVAIPGFGQNGRQRKLNLVRVSGSGWRFASVYLGNYPAGRMIEYHGKVAYSDYRGLAQDLAIDNINYVNCDPHNTHDETSLNCTFDENECGWNSDNANGQALWTRTTKSPNLYGPQQDHTGKGGNFLFIDSETWSYVKGSKARLISLKQPKTDGRCFTFWYHMFGQDVGTLNVIIQTSSFNITILTKSNSQGNIWKQALETIQSDIPYYIVIEGIVGSFRQPMISIDDIFVLEENCPTPVECDFEVNFCGWEDDGWKRQSGKGNIPAVDHSTETAIGQYAALTQKQGSLKSPSYDYSINGHCLKFWYFLEGTRAATLQVIREAEDQSSNKTRDPVIWSDMAQPDKSGQWVHAMTNIDDLDIGKYRMYFIGTKDNISAVALDDVRLADGACPAYGSCTFEEDLCTWRNLGRPYSSGLIWLRNSGKTPSHGTGPTTDHTTGTPEGSYIYLDSNFGRSGQTAILESENLHYADGACVKFWYHMTGNRVGSLAVLFIDLETSKVTQLSGMTRSQGNVWKEYRYFFSSFPKSYRLRLKATQGSPGQGDIAVDDILIQSNTCEDLVITTPSPTISPSPDWDCNFETGTLCKWETDTSWIVQDGRRALINKEGPSTDHTLGTALGRYAYYHPLGDSTHYMNSTEIPTDEREYCFEFWYYLHSSAPVKLEIFSLQNAKLFGPIWTKTQSGGTEWKHTAYYFEKDAKMSIVIKPTRSELGIGDIALDDITVREGRCPMIKGQPCDFEAADICGYKMDSPDQVGWKRIQAAKASVGPKKDKSYNSDQGHYLIAYPSFNARLFGDNKAWLIMQNLPSTKFAGTCLRFWYQITGDDVVSLNVHVRTPGGQLTEHGAKWSHSTKNGNTWRIGQTTIMAYYPHDIVFEAVTVRGDRGYITLDDVLLDSGRCQPPGSCNFERDLCSWQNAEENATIEWIRNSGPTPTNFTGPEVDHTLGTKSGSYLYLNADNPAKKRNLVGILESEYFSVSSDRCMSFWVHMNGSEMGSLSVNISYYDFDGVLTYTDLSYSIEGNRGPKWLNLQLSMNGTDSTTHDEYRILIIGKTKGALSDIAIDDIDITNGVCYDVPNEKFDCFDRTHIDYSKVCDFEMDCGNGEDEAKCGNCDFEHGDCGWRDITSYYYQKWKVRKGIENEKVVGPGYDRTFNDSDGSFMLLETTYRSYVTSSLQSPENIYQFKKSYASCIMKFYYYHKDKSDATIRIKKRYASSTLGTVWERQGIAGDGWQLGVAYLGTTERPFYVEIEHQSSYDVTFTAIDDITFENCSLPAVRTCKGNEYKCTNKRCISMDLRCDLTDDCGDNSDEIYQTCWYYPTPCTFDTFGDCEWTTSGKRHNWTIEYSKSTRGNSNSGPTVDHTKGINDYSGKYLVLKRAQNSPKYNQSLYISPNYVVSRYSSCDLRFYYYMHGKDVANLRVHVEFENEGWRWRQLFSREGNHGQAWNRALVRFSDRNKPFHFIIEGILGEGKESQIGIDDLSLSYGCENYTGQLPDPQTTVMPLRDCEKNEYRCLDGNIRCIPEALKCDFNMDCADGSDEINCGPCDFETDMCGWAENGYGRYQWVRMRGNDSDVENGLKVDSKNSSNGYFAYVTNAFGSFFTPAELMSPPLPPTSTHCVVSFWYYFDGINIRTLTLGFKQTFPGYTTTSRRWQISKAQGPQWNLQEVVLFSTSARGSNVIFTADVNWQKSATGNNVAVDDIKFLNCNPNTLLLDCNFDDDSFHNGFCFWSNKEFFKWQRGKGTTTGSFTGPTSDHTTGNGYYLYIDQRNQRQNQIAQLVSPQLPMNAPNGSCFSFWYHMYGRNIGSLTVKTGNTRPRTTEWTVSSTQGRMWKHAEVYLLSQRDFTVFIEAKTRRGPQGTIAIDDLKLIDGECPKTTSCDFEKDFCGWNTTNVGITEWTRSQGSGIYSEEKPDVDHTTNTEKGYFVYMPRKRPGDIARLNSPYYNNVGDICVKFWFNTYGDHIGTLALYQKTGGERRMEDNISLWMRSGDHFRVWKQGRVTMKSLPSFFISFEAQTGLESSTGFIALDDIKITHGICSELVTCNFEVDTCGWYNFNGLVDFDWVRRSGADVNLGVGPILDHTTDATEGHYMFAYLTDQSAFSKSMLLSEDIPLHPTYCFSFWYNMYNTINSSLHVEQMVIGKGFGETVSFLGDIQTSDIWQYAIMNITVPDAGEYFNLGLVAQVDIDMDNNTQRGIAVDDVTLKEDACGLDVTTTTIAPTTTYPSSKYDCDFEKGFCGGLWNNDDELKGKWDIVVGHSDKKLQRPGTDHTTQSTSGHYLTLNDDARSYYLYQKARLISGEGVTPTAEGICFKFWYHMYGNKPGYLSIKTQNFHDDDKYETLWTRSGSKSPNWVYEQIHIITDYNYRIVVEGAGSTMGFISVDDFFVNTGSCPPRDFCDVEEDYCGFGNDPESSLQWQRGIGYNSSGPKTDHTLGTKYGNYFYINVANSIKAGETAFLESSPYQTTRTCIRFWYYLYGIDVGKLNVYTSQGDLVEKRWSETGDNNTYWQASEVIFKHSTNLPFTYAFQFTAGNAIADGKVAIDDITIRDKCETLGSCNFEEDMCLYTNNPTEDLQWIRGSGEIAEYGPDVDITFGTQFGIYAYVSVLEEYGDAPNPAELISPSFPPVPKRCINYWYYRNGSDQPKLTVILRDLSMDLNSELIQYKGERMGKWINGQVEIGGDDTLDQYHIIFQAEFTDRKKQFVALDDIIVTEKECDDIITEKPTFSCDNDVLHISDDFRCDFFPDCDDKSDESECGQQCDFETDEPEPCNWKFLNTYSSSWNRTRAMSGEGIETDHTLQIVGEGHFLSYYNKWSNFDVGAGFYSPAQIQSSPTCRLFFWYYFISGYTNANDYISVSTKTKQNGATEVFRLRSSNTAKVWKLGEAVIGRVMHRFEVHFLAFKVVTSNLAIDDLKFENCDLERISLDPKPCELNEYQCTNKKCIPMDFVCDFTDDCGDYSDENYITAKCDQYPGMCDFEKGLCDWKIPRETSNSFTRIKANTNYYKPFVPRDHTKNTATGYFLYFESQYKRIGQVARLISPIMEAVNETCKLRFYYTYGTDFRTTNYETITNADVFTVYVRYDDEGAWDPILISQVPFGQYYERAVLSLGKVNKPFEIIIESRIAIATKGGWAFDDVSFTPGCMVSNATLPTLIPITTTEPPEIPCNEDEIACSDGQTCAKVCDFIPQCSDGSDEVKCGACNFDDDRYPTCGWSDVISGRWIRQKGDKDIAGPANDVSKQGYYMYVSKQKTGSSSSEAILRSIQLNETFSTCKVSFYYYLNGLVNRDTLLKLQLTTIEGHSFLLWLEKNDQGNSWKNMTVSIGKRSKGWVLDFIAMHAYSDGDIAIDEISFPTCAPPHLRACQGDDFHCGTNECVDRSLVCDFNLDCPNGEDEKNCTGYYERCDFENGDLCGWSQDDSYVKWLLKAGQDVAEGMGPKRDHTIGDETGSFLIAPGGSTSQWYQYVAALSSVEFKADTSEKCKLRLWYHMFGERESNLTINTKEAGANNNHLKSMGKANVSLGDQWVRAEFTLLHKLNFQVVIIGSPSTRSNGDIAIDDLSFTPECIPLYNLFTTPSPTRFPSGQCNKLTEFTCDDNSCVLKSQVCDFREDCRNGEDERNCPAVCTFEDGTTCGWYGKTVKGDGVEINVITAETAQDTQERYLKDALPDRDHTTNTSYGKYLLMHTSLETETGPLDEFRSPNFSSSASSCIFSFWYCARAALMKPLFALQSYSEESIDMIQITSTEPRRWIQDQMGIGRRKSNFSVGVYKKGYISKIDFLALDDLIFKNCDLPQMNRSTCNAFHCKINKACISNDLVCDMTDDCGDGSDEWNCGEKKYTQSDFETGFEFFRPVKVNSSLEWQVQNGTTRFHASLRLGPAFDHTSSSQTGNYLVFTKGTAGTFKQKGWLVSEVLTTQSDIPCKMRFYYYMYGKDVDDLNVMTRTTDSISETAVKNKWYQGGQLGNYWQRAEVLLDERQPFEVIIQAKAGMYTSDVIAVDDVSFTPGCWYVKGATLPPELTSLPPSTTLPSTMPTGCKTNEFECSSDKECISKDLKCDFKTDCSDGSDEVGCVQVECDFMNKNLCGWNIVDKPRSPARKADETVYQWIAIQANDPHNAANLKFRPERDHSWNSTEGFYLLADGGPGKYGDVSSLVSTKISATHARCALDFWFYCGTVFCGMKAYRDSISTQGEVYDSHLLWEAEKRLYLTSQTKTWVHALIHLDHAINYAVRIDAVRPYSPETSMCLDDISFESCPPPSKPEKGKKTCNGQEFQCDNGYCINSTMVCDLSYDCTDNSDEHSIRCNMYKASCNFESEGLCDAWKLTADKNTHWKFTTSQNSFLRTIPSFDHTKKTTAGVFMSVAPTWRQISDQPRPELYTSRVIAGGTDDCRVRIWYNIIGVKNAIEVFKRTSYDSGGMKRLAVLETDVQDYWHRAEIILSGDQREFQVVFIPKFGQTTGTVNLDDVSLTPDCTLLEGRNLPGAVTEPPEINDCLPERFMCKNKKCYTHAQKCNFIDDCGDNSDEENCGTSCTFQQTDCGWYNAPGHRGTWKRMSGIYRRISSDHTLGNKNGFYMAVTDIPISEGGSATLQTKSYIACGAHCKFTMWYHHSSVNKANITVDMHYGKKLPTGEAYKTLWTAEKEKEAIWRNMSVDINTQKNFAIAIQATGIRYSDSIAVDDIKFVDCSPEKPPVECLNNEKMCTDKSKCIPVWEICDGKEDCADGSDEKSCSRQPGDCDFDTTDWMKKCRWSSKKMDFEWTQAKSTHSDSTGPHRSHSKEGNGLYMFINSTAQAPGRQAGLAAPMFKKSQGKCHLRFWYFMKGSENMGKLRVLTESADQVLQPFFMVQGDQGSKWIQGHILVGHTQDYQVIFEGTIGGDDKTDIAIDDVRFTEGCAEGGDAIVPTGEPTLCWKDQFQCRDISAVDCISLDWKCDCQIDCADGSDEEGCTNICSSTVDKRSTSTPSPSPTKEIPTSKHTSETTPSTTATTPKPQCKSGYESCHDGTDTCIPLVYFCDGVSDCSNNYDETRNCPNIPPCGSMRYYCSAAPYPPCVTRDQMCNGKIECPDGSDEAFCGDCRDDYCKNNGTCSLVKNVPVCQCEKGYLQNRCNKLVETPDPKDDKTFYKSSSIAWLPGVIIGTILVIAIMFTIWYKRNTNAERQRLPHAVENPVYGVNLETLDFSELNAHTLPDADEVL